MQVALIHPPVTRASEPPIGVARLGAALRRQGHQALVLDANVEAQRWISTPARLRQALGRAGEQTSERGRRADSRAIRRIEPAMAALCDPATYGRLDRYRGAAGDLAAAMRLACRPYAPARMTPMDYAEGPLRDLGAQQIHAMAADPQRNPFEGYFRQRLLPLVCSHQPRLVGLSVLYSGQLSAALCLATLLRQALPAAHLVLGGGLGSSWIEALPLAPELEPVLTALSRYFDSVVQGEGEQPLLALCAALDRAPEAHAGSPPPGCLRRGSAGTLLQTAASTPPRLDSVARGDFSDSPLGSYLAPEPVLPLCGSRGCYWSRCTFCPEASRGTGCFQPRTAAELVAEMEQLHQRHGVRCFHLVDDAVPPRVLRGVAAEVARRGLGQTLRWYGFARAERALLEPGVARQLRAGGLRMLELGLESGSDRVLEQHRKGVNSAQCCAALETLHHAGIGTYVYVMFGLPGETEQDARQTADLVTRHAAQIDFLHSSIFRLTRGTRLEQQAGSFGVRLTRRGPERSGQPHHLGHAADQGMTGQQLRRFVARDYRARAEVRAIERRTPAVFGAGHGLFCLPDYLD